MRLWRFGCTSSWIAQRLSLPRIRFRRVFRPIVESVGVGTFTCPPSIQHRRHFQRLQATIQHLLHGRIGHRWGMSFNHPWFTITSAYRYWFSADFSNKCPYLFKIRGSISLMSLNFNIFMVFCPSLGCGHWMGQSTGKNGVLQKKTIWLCFTLRIYLNNPALLGTSAAQIAKGLLFVGVLDIKTKDKMENWPVTDRYSTILLIIPFVTAPFAC